MLGLLVNKPNTILQRQREFQASSKPLWHRPPRAGLALGVYYTAFTVSSLGTVYGLYSLIKGKPAE